MSARPLEGQTAFVTGGSRGLGKAIVRRLADAGARVAFTYRAQKAEALALEREFEGTCAVLEMEVSDRKSVENAMLQATDRFGPFSILVNNAGINKPTDFDQVSDEDWDHILG
ncbi:MAG: SDR family NAD(P)-dependent oxidoreductase, partial [Alphaproteobacteria bacterium]|nr:SDR family NAD(P)-dependent oxidoreductase [Alphaproteobacteria bacterium]